MKKFDVKVWGLPGCLEEGIQPSFVINTRKYWEIFEDCLHMISMSCLGLIVFNEMLLFAYMGRGKLTYMLLFAHMLLFAYIRFCCIK